MDVNNELIRKFLNNECDPVEAEIVAAYLNEHPELLDEIYNESAWKAEEGADLPAETWNRMWTGIMGRRTTKWILYPAAACVLAIAAIFLLKKPGTNKAPIVQNVPAKKDTYQGTVLGNRSDSVLRTTLPDGTVMYLSGHSEIRYDQSAWKGKREIVLEGEAVFYVAKDMAKPFTVYCDRLGVTALGTVFWVNGNTKGDGHKVRLFEGKVVVKPHDASKAF